MADRTHAHTPLSWLYLLFSYAVVLTGGILPELNSRVSSGEADMRQEIESWAQIIRDLKTNQEKLNDVQSELEEVR